MTTAVTLVSGGIDSCVLCSTVAQKHQLAMLHVDYHHKAREQERRAFDRLCAHYQPRYQLVVELSHFEQIGGSALVDAKVAIDAYTETSAGLARTYLPFGFPTMWSVAASWAQTIGADLICVGGAEDYGVSLPAYAQLEPTIDREMIQLFNHMLQKTVRPGQKTAMEMPFYSLSRAAILRLAEQLDSPLEHTWSCYSAGPNPCQNCYRCLVRDKGFRSVGKRDPGRTDEV